MVIKEVLEMGIDLMKGKDYANPILEAVLLLSSLLDVDKSYLYIHSDREVGEEIYKKFLHMMERRASGYPLQYLLGFDQFMGLDLHLGEGVLIPRPETETLVEYVINEVRTRYDKEDIKILDLGLGSGAISISLAKFCPSARVYGVDISHEAIKFANINKEKHKLSNVHFYQGDLFDPIKKLHGNMKFHFIVSNPPYIKSEDIDKLQIEVKDFEPRIALDGGLDGLDYYRRISSQAKDFLMDKGTIVYEIGYDQGKEVGSILKKEGFTQIRLLKDFQNHDRVAIGCME